MNTKATVIYHSADFDGLFCREIARKFLPNAELIGWNYGDAKLSFPNEGTLYILDLSPECFAIPLRDDVKQRVVWIDHHKSAIESFPSNIPGYRIDGVAACRLTWQWFTHEIANNVMSDPAYLPQKDEFLNRQVSEPLAVRLAGEYDIWDRHDPNAELFQHGLRSFDLNEAGAWAALLMPGDDAKNYVDSMLDKGKAVQYAKTKENEDIITNYGFTIQFEGLTFLACNHARYNSHLFTAGLKPEHDACFGFKWDGKIWEVSLYHAPGKEHHDLSFIAVKYGGGGHRGACGFRTDKLPFL